MVALAAVRDTLVRLVLLVWSVQRESHSVDAMLINTPSASAHHSGRLGLPHSTLSPAASVCTEWVNDDFARRLLKQAFMC